MLVFGLFLGYCLVIIRVLLSYWPVIIIRLSLGYYEVMISLSLSS